MEVCRICLDPMLESQKLIRSKRKRFGYLDQMNEPEVLVHLECQMSTKKWI